MPRRAAAPRRTASLLSLLLLPLLLAALLPAVYASVSCSSLTTCEECARPSPCWWCESSQKCLDRAFDVFSLPWASFAARCPGLNPAEKCPASGLAIWDAEQCHGELPFTYECPAYVNYATDIVYYTNATGFVPLYLIDGSRAFACSDLPCCQYSGRCPLPGAASPSPIARSPGSSDVVFSLLLAGANGDPLVLAQNAPLKLALRKACAALLGGPNGSAVDVEAFSILALSNASDASAAES
jgi:hypothetical protein